tara:strand:- start:1820 stop:2830 length:1011 start_codon:yes stop_codon:yes gene_type:complete
LDYINAITLFANYIFIPGLSYGCQLALGALGITIVYTVLRFSNFAHGEFMSFGAMISILVMWYFQDVGISIHPLPTIILALPISIILTIIFCLLIDNFCFSYYRKNNSESVILLIVSIGIMFFTNGLIRLIIGPADRNINDGERFLVKARTIKKMFELNEGLAIKMSQCLTITITILLVTFVFWFLNKTKTGKSMRAYSDNKDLSLLSGINPERVVLITWVIAGMLACVAGTLYGLDKSYKPFTYLNLVLPIFASAIVGGVGNPIGAIIGGFVIAYSEIIITFAYRRFLGYLLPENLLPESLMQVLSTDYKIAVSFLILVIVLIIKPTGIYKGKLI